MKNLLIVFSIVILFVVYLYAQQPGGKYRVLEATDNLIPAPDTVTAPKVLGEIRHVGATLYRAINLSGAHKWGRVGGDSLSISNQGDLDTHAPYWLTPARDALWLKTWKGENGIVIRTNSADSSLRPGLILRSGSNALSGDTTNLESGDASLTLTGITNIASVSSATGTYNRTGNVVNVDILIGFTATAGSATFTEIDCTMPKLPEIPANQRINGVYSSLTDFGMVGSSPAAINKVRISFRSNTTSPSQANVHYSYKIK